MRDSNSSSWPLFYGDKTLPNGQYCNGFKPRTITDSYPRYDKDILSRKCSQRPYSGIRWWNFISTEFKGHDG
ncbi:hypothetical protein HAX54_033339 [Datura stramonium]|uniref:Uncharacterized protein n=1 Tax=Datura stramonium TaxID=4076 RepID=A0ABS8SD86_DATST|nr:hypothetical protein [Datura stramonium]